MPLTADQRSDILAYLEDEAETAGLTFDSKAIAEFMLDHWDSITDLTQMERKSLRREIRMLRDQRPILRAELDAVIARIAEIDAILNP
jgi:hypothetical protein